MLEMESVESPPNEAQSVVKAYLHSSTKSKVYYMLLCFPLLFLLQMKIAFDASADSASFVRNLVDDPLSIGMAPADLSRNSAHRGPCLNEDFESVHDIAVVTIGLRKTYLNPTVLLGVSIRQHSTIKSDLVLMEDKSQPLPAKSWVALKKAGWKRCLVEPIADPASRDATDDSSSKSTDYSKLSIWQLTQYRTALFMNPDTLVVGDLNPLLTMNLDAGIGASADFIQGQQALANTFNIGVLKVKPSLQIFDRLMAERAKGSDHESLSEWLNIIFRDKWKDIGFVNNANLAALNGINGLSDEGINVIHFTDPKPWACVAQSDEHRLTMTDKYCSIWTDSWNIHSKLSQLRKSTH